VSGARPAPGGAGRRPHPALAERRRAIARERGRRRRSGVLLLLGTAAAIALVYWLATGPLLAVQDVRVSGYDRDDRAELIAALESAAGGGTIISPATADMDAAARAFPWVESISVSRTWPRGLAVQVREAQPVAVAVAGDRTVMLTAAGRVLGDLEGQPGVGWMRLPAEPPPAGGTIPEGQRAALDFIAAARPEVGSRVRALAIGPDGALQGRLRGGPPLRLGPPERLAAKASALALVLSSLTPEEEQSASYIDLTFPERPALGPAV
jgi:cell division protein FtsQ